MPIKTKVRKALKDLDKVLSNTSREGLVVARDLWNILSAVRGPDRHDESAFKGAVTGVIRKVAFPKAFKRTSRIESSPNQMSVSNGDAKTFALQRNQLESGHFRDHGSEAFTALGLSWAASNEPKAKKKKKRS